MSESAKQRINRFRASGNVFMLRRDTALMECALGINAIVNGVQVTMNDTSGKSLAPFLDSGLSFLVFPKLAWIVALIALGVLTLAGLIHGLVLDNHLLLRARFAIVAACLWSVLAAAIVVSAEPKITAARYILTAFWSVVVYLILHTRQRERHVTMIEIESGVRQNVEREPEGAQCVV